jgi:hypothetical protein
MDCGDVAARIQTSDRRTAAALWTVDCNALAGKPWLKRFCNINLASFTGVQLPGTEIQGGRDRHERFPS